MSGRTDLAPPRKMLKASQFLAQKHKRLVTEMAKVSRQVRHWSPAARKTGFKEHRVAFPCFTHSSNMVSARSYEYGGRNFVNQRQLNYSTAKIATSSHSDRQQGDEEVGVSLLGCGQQRLFVAPKVWDSPFVPRYQRSWHLKAPRTIVARVLFSTGSTQEKLSRDHSSSAPLGMSQQHSDKGDGRPKKSRKKRKRMADLPPEDPSLLDQAKAAMRRTPSLIVSGSKTTLIYIKGRVLKPSLLNGDWIYVKSNVKEFLHHHWTGLKLLWMDVKTASSILSRVVKGHSLTRRERRMLLRTTSDIFRLIPFSFFVIIPAMEFLLPVVIKIFPNMLPSTFQDKLKKEEDMKKLLRARLNLARFIQDTVEELASDIKDREGKSGGENDLHLSASKLLEMIEAIQEGERVNPKQLMELTHIFKDSITLDRLPRAQLVAMCRFMNMRTFGADSYLRYQLRSRLGQLQKDDQQILWEGLESLNLRELKEACHERGMRATGMLKADYRRQLQGWLDLSVKRSIPTSLLILSRSLLITTEQATEISEENVTVEALKESISALDEEVITHAVLEAASASEIDKPDLKEQTVIRELKIEELKAENELIEDEREELEDALEDLEEFEEHSASATDVVGEETEKRTSWTVEDNAKPLLSTDGGAKVDDFVAKRAIVVEDEALVESKGDDVHSSVQGDGSQRGVDDVHEKLGDSTFEAPEKVLNAVLTPKELETLAMLTEPSIVHKEREILSELKAKVEDAQISSMLEEEREQAEEVWIDEDDFVDDDDSDEADDTDADIPNEDSGDQLTGDKKSSGLDEEEEFEEEDMIEALTTSSSNKEAQRQKREDSKRREKVQAMVKKLESQIDKVDETVGDKLNVIQVLDLGGLGEFIPTEQLRAAIIDVLNTHNDEEEADAIIAKLDLNKDGFVDVNDLRFLQKMEPNEIQDFIQSFTEEEIQDKEK